MEWEEKKVTKILRQKTDEVSYSMGENEQHVDESKNILKYIFSEYVSFSASGSDEETFEEADVVTFQFK